MPAEGIAADHGAADVQRVEEVDDVARNPVDARLLELLVQKRQRERERATPVG